MEKKITKGLLEKAAKLHYNQLRYYPSFFERFPGFSGNFEDDISFGKKDDLFEIFVNLSSVSWVPLSSNDMVQLIGAEPMLHADLVRINFKEGYSNVKSRYGDLGYFDKQSEIEFEGKKYHKDESPDGTIKLSPIHRVEDGEVWLDIEKKTLWTIVKLETGFIAVSTKDGKAVVWSTEPKPADRFWGNQISNFKVLKKGEA